MSLPVQQQLKYWGIAMAVFLLALWYLGDVMMPFILGGAVAYFLDPVADRLEAMGLSRVMATVLITIFGFLIFVLLLVLVIPALMQQTAAIIESAPGYVHTLKAFLKEKFPSVMDESSALRRSLDAFASTISARGTALLEQMVASVMTVINLLALTVLVPVIAFYLLLDWDHMIARINALLPREHAPTIRELAREIDHTLASFIRGQGTVCLILGTYYAVALMLAGLQGGLVVGVIAGALTFIPYVGALVGGGLALGLALFQFWGEWQMIGIVGAIFVSGQMLEGNFLTPKLVGSSVGLHPVWLIFALSAFGSVFGFVGMLVAVPVAAAIGVLVRFVVRLYINSPLYRGPHGAAPPPQQGENGSGGGDDGSAGSGSRGNGGADAGAGAGAAEPL